MCVEEPFAFSVTCPFANSAHFPAGYGVSSFVFVGAVYTEGISPQSGGGEAMFALVHPTVVIGLCLCFSGFTLSSLSPLSDSAALLVLCFLFLFSGV